jgi:NAD(P)-dependent dehydrogenase (short-subunit alcohol dehydrogenase family)
MPRHFGKARNWTVFRLNNPRLDRTSLLSGHVAVVTGASSGIGRALALALSRKGVEVCAVGRNPNALAETVAAARQFSDSIGFQLDLTVGDAIRPIVQHLERGSRGLHILVHSAGIYHQAQMEQARVEDLDAQYAANVRAPYTLTKSLLPLLAVARGQIIFVNSSAGLTAKRPQIGQYSATKHALKAIADSLREEVNAKGIRVLSLYLGRTATPMQEALYREEGRDYHPETLIQPEDVASVVVQALMLPGTAELTDISMRPMRKS